MKVGGEAGRGLLLWRSSDMIDLGVDSEYS